MMSGHAFDGVRYSQTIKKGEFLSYKTHEGKL